MIESIMKEEKPNQKERFSIKYEDLRKYFPESYSNEQIEKRIIKLLESYSKKQKDKINGVFM